jgi:hypothetical protein
MILKTTFTLKTNNTHFNNRSPDILLLRIDSINNADVMLDKKCKVVPMHNQLSTTP